MTQKVILIGCSKKKAATAAPARELYQGQLFKLCVEWAEQRGCPWVILSTKYGVLRPEDKIEPYTFSFASWGRAYLGENRQAAHATATYRRVWGAKASAVLRGLFPDATFVSLCGLEYEKALIGLQFESPLAGMGIGERLRALTQWVKNGSCTVPAVRIIVPPCSH